MADKPETVWDVLTNREMTREEWERRMTPDHVPDYVTDGECGRTWDDAHSTYLTPAPSARCPFEYEHEHDKPESAPVAQAPVTQESDENAAPSTQPHTWADGFGMWHVRVRRSIVSPLIAARRALRDELQARDVQVARNVWLHPVRVEEMDDDETMVYREGSAD